MLSPSRFAGSPAAASLDKFRPFTSPAANGSSAKDTTYIRSTTTSPIGKGRTRINPRKPFKCGVDDIDLEVSVVTRSLDRILNKKLENLLSADAISAAAPYIPAIAGTPLTPITSGRGSRPSSPHILDAITRPSTVADSTRPSTVASKSPSSRPPSRPPLVYLQNSDALVPNPNISDGLEFEVGMILRALERLVNKMLDVVEKEHASSEYISHLEMELGVMTEERDILRARLAGYTASADSGTLIPITSARSDDGTQRQRVPAVVTSNNSPPGLTSVGTQTDDSGGAPTSPQRSMSPPTAVSIPASPTDQSLKAAGGGTDVYDATEDIPPPSEDSCWGKITRCMKSGTGDYEFKLMEDSKLQIIHEASFYALEYLADSLLIDRNPVIIIKEFKPPAKTALRFPKGLRNLGIGLHLETIKYETVAPLEFPEEGALPNDPAPVTYDVGGNTMVINPPLDKGKGLDRRHGVIYHTGTRFGFSQWENPVSHNRVYCCASSTWGSCDLSDLVKKDVAYFMTANHEGSFVEIDLLCGAIIPVAYSFSSAHPIYAGYYPRSWEIWGSVDKKQWRVLRKHRGDETIDHHNPFGIWDLPVEAETEKSRYYRFFRIVQTGPNSFGSHELQISAFEVYGRFMYIASTRARPSPKDAYDEKRPEPDDADELPIQPKPPKGKGKGKGKKK